MRRDVRIVVRQALTRAQQVTVVREARFIRLLPRHRRSGDAWQISVTWPDGDTDAAQTQARLNNITACIQASGCNPNPNHLLSW